MMKPAILALIEAKPGKEQEVGELLRGAQALAAAEPGTLTWYAFQVGPRSFGIFDTFGDDAGRTAHLEGKIAQALMTKADELLAGPPSIRKVDVLAAK